MSAGRNGTLAEGATTLPEPASRHARSSSRSRTPSASGQQTSTGLPWCTTGSPCAPIRSRGQGRLPASSWGACIRTRAFARRSRSPSVRASPCCIAARIHGREEERFFEDARAASAERHHRVRRRGGLRDKTALLSGARGHCCSPCSGRSPTGSSSPRRRRAARRSSPCVAAPSPSSCSTVAPASCATTTSSSSTSRTPDRASRRATAAAMRWSRSTSTARRGTRAFDDSRVRPGPRRPHPSRGHARPPG